MKHALLIAILQLLVVFTPVRCAGLLSDLGISSDGDGEDLVLTSGGSRRSAASAPSALQRTRVLEHRDFQRNLTSTNLNLQTAPFGKDPRSNLDASFVASQIESTPFAKVQEGPVDRCSTSRRNRMTFP